MHRFVNLKSFYHSKFQLLANSSAITINTKVYFTSCSHCRNVKNHLKSDSHFYINKRFQSTREALIPRSTRKKKTTKNIRKYVELLEVNDKVMKETTAVVTKFKAKHFSKLASSNDVSLGELHKLKKFNQTETSSKVPEDKSLDMELIKEIENSVLNMYRQNNDVELEKDKQDGALIFMSEKFFDLQPFRDKHIIKMIQDSYDKFRRETVRDQKMNDHISAINEGVTQNIVPDADYYKDSKPSAQDIKDEFSNSLNKSKGAHEIFREYLSEFKQSHDPLDIDNIRNIEDLEARGIHIPCIAEFTQESDDLHSSKGEEQGKTLAGKKSKKSKAKHKKSVADQFAKQKFIEMQKKVQAESLNLLLMAHLEVCIAVGSLNKVMQILNFYRNRANKSQTHASPLNVELYNILLHGFGGQGDYKSVSTILEIMQKDSIEKDTQSYAAIFECLQRSEINNKFSLLNNFKDEMFSKGIQLNDLCDKCKFTKDQKQHVVEAILLLEPHFKPHYTAPLIKYNCPLTNHLNANSQKKSDRKYTSPAEGLINTEGLMKKAKHQIENEISGTLKIENITNNVEPSKTILFCREKLKKWEDDWKEIIRKAFYRNLNVLKTQSSASHSALNICPYLTSIQVEEFVELLILEIRKLSDGSETYSPTVRSLQRELGFKVFLRYQIQNKQQNGVMEKVKDVYSKYCDWYIHRRENDSEKYNSRRKLQQLIHENRDGASIDIKEHSWPNSVCVSIGKFLYNILMNDIKVDINVFKKDSKKPKYMPALYNVYRGQGYKINSEVKLHPLLVRLVRESCPLHICLDASLVPSLCPPLPWTDHLHGGYLLTETHLMRIVMGNVQQKQRLEDAPPSALLPALDCLNQLGTIPWCINRPVLDVLIQVFRSGGSRDLKVAQAASAVPMPPPINASLSRRERALAHRTRALLSRRRQEMYSLWCDTLYKLSLANHYRNDIFWLPHNMDFRGRVYPVNPHLSHLGGDGSRAVLLFARGQPLGPRGLDWLKLHCINLSGTMKRNSAQERLNQANKEMDNILDSADRPLEGRLWWALSEKPWQTLACCMEIANASRSPNPEEYICHFPIHQDGSCNGLQHYAALGGDTAGAHSVNLAPAEVPQDVYSAVVSLVEGSRARDAAAGIEVAKSLDGFIKRKVIKQTVMTTVYGVTRFGARLQIAKQLKDLKGFPKEHVWTASTYLTSKTFESLREMFTSTKEIQDWFTECAKVISGVCNENVEWITPLGLPVVQPYLKTSKALYSRDGTLEYSPCDQYDKPCVMKQKNAFPPNFIHSLDSSHMMLTSLNCEERDITFVSVHDCFWTHASTVDLMNQVCREQFVALHSQPILENLSEYFLQKYGHSVENIIKSSKDPERRTIFELFTKLPKKGDFDLHNVLKSIYFFS